MTRRIWPELWSLGALQCAGAALGSTTGEDNSNINNIVIAQAILAHKATKVFITHCGMHGVLEAIYHQVMFELNCYLAVFPTL